MKVRALRDTDAIETLQFNAVRLQFRGNICPSNSYMDLSASNMMEAVFGWSLSDWYDDDINLSCEKGVDLLVGPPQTIILVIDLSPITFYD